MSQKLEQESQLKNSRVYSDTLTPGATLETPVAPGDHIEHDLNATRTMLALHRQGAGGEKWYTPPEDGFGLQEIHDKILVVEIPPMPGTTDFVIPAGPNLGGVLIPATLIPGGAGLIGVGPSSLTNLAYAAALEANFLAAGTLGVGLSTSIDGRGVLLNRCSLLDDDTNDHPETAGQEQIFGLLQAVAGTADGAIIGGAGSENLQLSFVYYDKATDVLTLTTLPPGTYHFSLPQQLDFYTLNRGAFLGGGALPSIIDPGGAAPRLPFIEWDITAGPNIARGDIFDITTGTFAVAGARASTAASYGSVALPASATEFRDDSRVESWHNGQKMSKTIADPGAASPRDVWWVSPTTVAFNFVLKGGEVLKLKAPSAY